MAFSESLQSSLRAADIFCFRDWNLVKNLLGRALKLKYRRSILGVCWAVLHPVLLACAYYFIFKFVMKMNAPHYFLIVLTGTLCWTFFAQTMSEGMESIVGNLGLVSKVPIPVQVFPLTTALTQLMTVLFALPVLILATVLSGLSLAWVSLFSVYFLLMLFVIGFAGALVLGLAYVSFRDFRHLSGVALQVWFFVTPVIYPLESVPLGMRKFLALNPVGHVFSGLHHVLFDGTAPSARELLIPFAWATAISLAAALVLNKHGHGIAERI